jgi:adenylate kinase
MHRTEVGREAEDIVAQGGLLPDEMVLKVVTSKLDKLHDKVGRRHSVISAL